MKNFKIATIVAIFDIRMERFYDSESLCPSDASYQLSVQFNIGFGRRYLLKNFKMATMAAILDIRTEQFQQF